MIFDDRWTTGRRNESTKTVDGPHCRGATEQAHTKSDQAEPYAKQRYEVLNTQMGSKSEPLQFRGLLSTAENLISAKKKFPNYKHFFFNLANIWNQAVPEGIPLHAVIVFQSNPPSKLLQHKNCQSVRSSLSYQSSNANGASEEGSNPIIQSQLLPTVCLGPGGWIG